MSATEVRAYMNDHGCTLAAACRALGGPYMATYWKLRGTQRYQGVRHEIPDHIVEQVADLMRSGLTDLVISERLNLGVNRVQAIRHGEYKPEVAGTVPPSLPGRRSV